MATDTVLSVLKNRNVTRQILDQPIVMKAYVDCTVTPLATADAYPIFQYDADTLIMRAGIIVATVNGGTATIDLKDATGGTDIISAADLETLGSTNATLAADFYGDAAGTADNAGRFMTTAGDLTLDTASEALAAAQFYVWVEIMKFKTTD
jgi:hypothetical protein